MKKGDLRFLNFLSLVTYPAGKRCLFIALDGALVIIYSATKDQFCQDVRTNMIDTKLYDLTLQKVGRRTPEAEIRSWKNSLQYMNNILTDPEIPNDSYVGIEFKIPGSNNRIDFIISGQDHSRRDSAVIIELKQWSDAERTEKDAVVKVSFGSFPQEVTHPSYQAWSYVNHLQDYNSAVQENNIQLIPCAYLHNCKESKDLTDQFYSTYIEKSPLFLQYDVEKLGSFIKKYVKYGDSKDILYTIDNGKVRPSKSLADQLSSMLAGNQEFTLIDDQKVVYETAIQLAKISSARNKNVLIVEGGPGSGKSVVAINLLSKFTELGKTSQYVTKNAAPRAVFERKLTGQFTKTRISNLFKGSGAYTKSDRNDFDTLIIDEAHRLNEKSGLYGNEGINQVFEVIKSSTFSVFFIDESQRVTFKDIGTKEEIEKWAKKENAPVTYMSLKSQFRCNGSDGYIAWLDNALQVRETANTDFSDFDYEFKVYDDPKNMHEEIIKKNKVSNKSRIVAGYCWEWPSKKNKSAFDIQIEDFKVKWNLSEHGSAWIIHEDSVAEAGCIHTCQGLELDYVGVIIGPDLIVRDGKVVTDGLKRAKTDQSIKGFKTLLKTNPEKALSDVDLVIKNTYRTLMTRGMKGCYIYCTDKETRDYFKERLRKYEAA